MDDQGRGLQDWPDRDLVVAFKGGVPEAYDEMYRRYNARITSVCRRMLKSPEDAREATQETFLKAYVALPRFNGQYRLGAWLSRIATNVCVDHIRRRARGATLTPLTEQHEGAEVELGPEDVVVQDVPALTTLEDLQPLHARALELRNLQGFSHKEIADQLGMSPLQVKALLHRARVSFKRAWGNASGWALAPLVAIRSILHQGSKDASSISAQVPIWTQAASPLIAERVAASAMVVVVALSGTASVSPATVTQPTPTMAAPFADAGDPSTSGATTDVPDAVADHGSERALVAVVDVKGLLEQVKESADDQTRERKDEDKKQDEDDSFDPGSADRASQKLVRETQDEIEDLLDR